MKNEMAVAIDNEVSEDEVIKNVNDESAAGDSDPDVDQKGVENDVIDEDEVVITIGEESPPQEDGTPAPEWVRELRKSHREQQKENRELKAKLEQLSGAEKKPVELGKKPVLADFDYDTELYEKSLETWQEQKRQVEADKAKAEAERMNHENAWKETLAGYEKKKKELKVRDYEDAEAAVLESLSQVQQGVILQGADDPSSLVYALGKNDKKLKELSAIKDHVKFAFAVAKLETQLKVTNRKAATQPEKTVSGTGRTSGSVDSTLERLRAEAEKSGNYTKVIQYKKQKRQT